MPPDRRRMMRIAAFFFGLAFPFLVLMGVGAMSLPKSNWFVSMSFTRLAMLSGLPLIWWLLYRSTWSKAAWVTVGMVVTLIFFFLAVMIHDTSCDC